MMILEGKEMLELIPQRPPMVMIDRLEDHGEDTTVTSLLVSPDNLFFEEGKLKEPALVEAIAQTAAARVGYICKGLNKIPPIGYIAAVSRLKIYGLPDEGDRIFMEVKVESQVLQFTLIKGKVTCGERLLAECEMKIFLNETQNPS
ncbi:hydroxymyristoyl-ACP dehydratase [bacterium]|nr:hydroxymyristoyl-ACP dehydratase [bacterium]